MKIRHLVADAFFIMFFYKTRIYGEQVHLFVGGLRNPCKMVDAHYIGAQLMPVRFFNAKLLF